MVAVEDRSTRIISRLIPNLLCICSINRWHESTRSPWRTLFLFFTFLPTSIFSDAHDPRLQYSAPSIIFTKLTTSAFLPLLFANVTICFPFWVYFPHILYILNMLFFKSLLPLQLFKMFFEVKKFRIYIIQNLYLLSRIFKPSKNTTRKTKAFNFLKAQFYYHVERHTCTHTRTHTYTHAQPYTYTIIHCMKDWWFGSPFLSCDGFSSRISHKWS